MPSMRRSDPNPRRPRRRLTSRIGALASAVPTLCLLGAMPLGLVACSSSSTTSERPASRTSRDADATQGFAIGASEWSRGGRRSAPDPPPPPTLTIDERTFAASSPPQTDPGAVLDEPLAEAEADRETPEIGGAAPTRADSRSTPGPSSQTRSGGATPALAAASPDGAATNDDPPAVGNEIVMDEAEADDAVVVEAVIEEPVGEAVASRGVASPSTAAAAGDRPAPPAVGTRETAVGRDAATGPERPLAADPIEAAAAILAAGVRSPDPVVRANALEGMLAWPALLREHVAGGLVDDNRGVRFVAAMCVGRARLTDLSHLVQPLVRDRSDSVRAAAIYALRRCGRPVDPSPLATMIRSDDPEVRSNAYIVLGELADPSSVGMVRESLGRGMRRVHPIRVRIVELQAAETLVKLGSDDELEVVRAALFAPVEQGELSILACQILARLGDRSAAPMLERLVLASGTSARPPEIRMAATQALAELGSRTQVDAAAIAVNAAQAPDPLLRAQACAVAGAAGGTAAVDALRSRLSDPVEFVRITAAGNLLKAASESSSVADATGVR